MRRADLLGPAELVAPGLLGAVVTSTVNGVRVSVQLTEVEAYAGVDDPASHSFRGRTSRNSVMFGGPGRLYVYFVYGMHWCANVVCGPPGEASAVLLRAGRVVDGLAAARERRPAAHRDADLARGPARLARCLGLDGSHDGTDLLGPPPGMVRLSGRAGSVGDVASGPRVGVAAAAEVPWRFWVPDEPSVSAYRRGGRPRRNPVAGDRQNGAP